MIVITPAPTTVLTLKTQLFLVVSEVKDFQMNRNVINYTGVCYHDDIHLDSKGFLEYCISDEWYKVTASSAYTWGTEEARVICRQIGQGRSLICTVM